MRCSSQGPATAASSSTTPGTNPAVSPKDWGDDPGSASLGFYDTATNTITTVPLDGFVDEIRIP
jgi:hypothetical protein